MKKTVHFLLTLCVLIGLGWTLWIGMRKQQGKPQIDEVETGSGGAPAAEEKSGDFVVKLEKERWEALGVEIAPIEKTDVTARRMAFGRVLDPTRMVTLEGDLASVDAALEASRAERERTQGLFKVGEGVARKVVESAEAQFRADEIRAEGLRRTALMEWGPGFAALEAPGRRALVGRLVSGEAALVRVDVLPGEAPVEEPRSARLLVLGREGQPVETREIVAAFGTDPKTQAQGFIVRVDQPPFPLRPGMAVTAWLELPEKPRGGFMVPRSALLRHDGRAWAYVQEEEGTFVRKPVTLDTPLEGDKGWFIAADGGGLEADDELVVTGAQGLLSEELKAQGGAEVD